MRDELLGYYERELSFLRQMGAEFAQKYPKIASRLSLEEDKCEDPHVERMIEAFAFLAGRIRLKIDDEFPHPLDSRGKWPEAFLTIGLRCINDTQLSDLNLVDTDGLKLIDTLRFF